MDTETISGLHSCKPGNEPIEGQVKLMIIEHRPAVGTKKAWIKIKNAGEKFGGTPFRILSASPTGYKDDKGNISFNIEVEPSSSQPTAFQNARATMQQGRVPREESRSEEIPTKGNFLHAPDSDWPDAQQGKPASMQDAVFHPERLKNEPESPPPDQNGDLDIVRRRLMQAVNLEVLCIRAVDKGIAPHCPEIAQTADFFQSQVASLFIWATRQGLENKMPETPIK